MIEKLLVANRGEIAARVQRTAHRLGIGTVAVFSDADSGAGFVHDADEAVRLPGTAPADTYLRGDLVIAAALATGADAVHPGYGFLSENAGFARDCAAAGLTFVGPSPEAIAAMGSKVEAKALMEAAGVPVLPGVTVTAETDLAAAGERIGFPLLVKAAYGGGGRGMRVVDDPAALADAVESARREAAGAFGDGLVFLERYLVDPRHVEVQILGDAHGAVVHLFERECSIQRRHQKIVEECPSPAVSEALRAELGAAAVAAGKAIGYTGAGTVEFVLVNGRSAGSAGEFFFLEVNTRLQVEHPVTELVTGLDLVEQQLRIAEGAPLGPEVRDATITGHAIEARLYAEDVTADGYLPATGTLHRFDVPGEVRVDSGVGTGSVVSPHYDPMLAKVIAHAPTRTGAARALGRALSGAALHGVTTNRDLLVGILRSPEFLAGDTDTGFLVRHDPVALGAGTLSGDGHRHAAAAALAAQASHRSSARVLAGMPSGWRNVGGAFQRVTYRLGERELPVSYRFRRDGLDLRIGDEPLAATPVSVTPDAVVLEIDGIRRIHRVHRADGVSYVDGPDGSVALHEVPRFADPNAITRAGSLLAPMPGSVARVHAAVGDEVTAGQPLVVLEAMKMEHTIAAPADGVLGELRVTPGDQVDSGQVLAVVEEPGS
ncbi:MULTISPECIES: acetyl/propionyl/methylcrotonyl-CoA carboxylase subunit alpha [Pseudonocardia]|uniref:Acetyl-/propionyl-coenzyme A carboxylase alpha chain n=2 Tax=Pseudonocardia TaxID=1847 RepID=A0A1Y2MK61_PSEAH|nr:MULTISPECIES: biotin carboxylase N-terminal domain-containing protein [Pseudonocardia]OSY35562.1 Acetyl-/propionyl-coenzyme A carboxylase alpha chain [Pseudonocardia autotrophica]TDN76313.1 acetyl/propionyl-CoA carboxylase alpha subunit [Pseudonocardia autotrophica]BBG00296.1 acetyl/propionyl-CoA carboxylase subunit alpha [Pseudonocardia autotrophica]GEC27513.1 acetyl/propionyl-CoA carboxylase subuit alpha [Pseudonocardia saturnea]